jgi:hypothetical protein
MKKYLLSAVLMVAISISANAQFSLGIKGGVNYSSLNSDSYRSSNVTGYQAGIFVRAGGAVYLQPELYLNSTGGEIHSNDNSVSGKVTFTNLSLPVLVGVRFGPPSLNFRVMAGPVYNNVLSRNENFSNSFNASFNNIGNYNSNNFGYQAGAGIDLSAISVDFRYQGGFSNVNDNFNQRQNIWLLSLGIKIL